MNSNLSLRSPVKDAVRRWVRHAGSLFSRLLCLASARDVHTALYTDPLLALDFDSVDLDNELRLQHRKAFAEWLALNLERQYDEVLDHFRGHVRPTALLQQWSQQCLYERLIPSETMAVERDLFLTDFEILLLLAENDLEGRPAGLGSESVGGSQSSQIDSAPTASGAPAALLYTKDVKPLMARVIAKEYLAALWDKGKINGKRYLEEVNRLRLAESLAPIDRSHPVSQGSRGNLTGQPV